MCQPYSPDCFRDSSVHAARERAPAAGRMWRLEARLGGLALAGAGALDIWLLVRLIEAVAAMLVQEDAPLVPALAAAGCAMQTGAALLLTWLLIDEIDGGPGRFS